MSGTLTLGQAAFMGDLQALRRELAKGPVIDEYDHHGLTLLHKLCGGPPRHARDFRPVGFEPDVHISPSDASPLCM